MTGHGDRAETITVRLALSLIASYLGVYKETAQTRQAGLNLAVACPDAWQIRGDVEFEVGKG
jgi:hypothetical protein